MSEGGAPKGGLGLGGLGNKAGAALTGAFSKMADVTKVSAIKDGFGKCERVPDRIHHPEGNKDRGDRFL